MAELQRTLSIIKPDAAARPGATGQILARIEETGLRVVALKKIQLSVQQVQGFYAVHKSRPFFSDLVEFMISGPGIYEEARKGDVRDSQADVSFAREQIGFEPLVSFEDGLRRTAEWYRDRAR